MRRGMHSGLFAAALMVCLTAPVRPAAGQGLEAILRARARVFPAVGPGVSAMKRDSTGRYYILAEPDKTILVYDAAGKPAGQIPNANSHGATIGYAVGFDIDSRNRLFVVDRGANAIKIFAPDGSLAAMIPVNAPTSVVALSDGQFAVTSLLSKRLVQIMTEKGAVIRTFGDPADQSSDHSSTQPEWQPPAQNPAKPSLADRGRIIGDPSGNIYFAFTSLPDPTLERFDRFGYSAYETVVSRNAFGSEGAPNRRLELGYTMAELGWPTSFSAWTDLHSLTSISMTGHGQRGRRGQGAAGSSSTSGSNPGSSSGSSSGSGFSSAAASSGSVTAEGNVLDYTADSNSDIPDDSNVQTNQDVALAFGPEMPGMFGMGIGGMFHIHPPGSFNHEGTGPDAGTGPHPDAGARPGGEGGPGTGFDHRPEGFHYHQGFETYRATITARVTLDNPPPAADDKPVITAVGLDPSSKDLWVGIRDMLVHFDSGSGSREDMYYLQLPDGASARPTSIIVEPDRLLIAADPWGIYEFPRPDRPATVAPPAQHAIVPQQLAPPHRASAPAPASSQP